MCEANLSSFGVDWMLHLYSRFIDRASSEFSPTPHLLWRSACYW